MENNSHPRPPEHLFRKEEGPIESGTALQAVRNNKTAVRVGFGVVAAASIVASVSGCVDGALSSESDVAIDGMNKASRALTPSGFTHFGAPQRVDWTGFGDSESINHAMIDGKHVLLFERNGEGSMYVVCDNIMECLTTATPQNLNNNTGDSLMYSQDLGTDVDGESSLYYSTIASPLMETAVSVVDGELTTVGDSTPVTPTISTESFTISSLGGQEFLMHEGSSGPYVQMLNLETGEVTTTPLASSVVPICGTAGFSDTAAVRTVYSIGGTGDAVCEMYMGETIADLDPFTFGTTATEVESQNVGSNPRIYGPEIIEADGTTILLYARYDTYEPGTKLPRYYYAVLDPYCGNDVCETSDTGGYSEDPDSCEVDCPIVGPTCGNDVCETELEEDHLDCPEDCDPPDPCVEDAVCDVAGGETEENCPVDCYVVVDPCDYDGECDVTGGETIDNCAADCTPPDPCGDDVCDTETEDHISCPADCDVPDPCVVDDVCDTEGGETEENCPVDCYVVVDPCNYDGECDVAGGETVDNCAADCEVVVDPCDYDGECDVAGGETVDNCAADCEVVIEPCGDGTCDVAGGEDYDSCALDCDPPEINDCDFTEEIVTMVNEEACSAMDCDEPVFEVGSLPAEDGGDGGVCELVIGLDTPATIGIEGLASIDIEDQSIYPVGSSTVTVDDNGNFFDTIFDDWVLAVTGTKYKAQIDELTRRLTLTVTEGSVDVWLAGVRLLEVGADGPIPGQMTFDLDTGEYIEDGEPCEDDPEAEGCEVPDPTCEEDPAAEGCEVPDPTCDTDPESCEPDPDPEPKGCGGCDSNGDAPMASLALLMGFMGTIRRKLRRNQVAA